MPSYYKIVCEDRYQRRCGCMSNFDTTNEIKLDKFGSSMPDGPYWVKLDFLGRYYKYGNNVAIIELPNDADIDENIYGEVLIDDNINFVTQIESIDTFWKKSAFYIDAVKHDEHALEWIKKKLQISELQMPEIKFMTRNLCLKAILKDPQSSAYVPDEFKISM